MDNPILNALLIVLLMVLLSIPALTVLLGPKWDKFVVAMDTWILHLREAKQYSNRHSPSAIERSRRERARQTALEDIAYFTEWIDEHRKYLTNSAPFTRKENVPWLEVSRTLLPA
jgi:hypothetical protein